MALNGNFQLKREKQKTELSLVYECTLVYDILELSKVTLTFLSFQKQKLKLFQLPVIVINLFQVISSS